MTNSAINLKALNRAEGPVQRFRALRAPLPVATPPPKKNGNYMGLEGLLSSEFAFGSLRDV